MNHVKISQIIAITGLVLLTIGALFSVMTLLFTSLVFLSILFITRKIEMKIQMTDILVFALFTTNAVFYFCSLYPPNSYFRLLDCFYVLLLYLYIRAFPWAVRSRIVNGLIVSAGFVLSLAGLLDFHALSISLDMYNLGDFIHYKNLYSPAGHLVNEWASLMLAFLPFPFIWYLREKEWASRWVLLVPSLTIFLSIVLSFSRGAYLALAVMALCGTCFILLFARKYLPKLLIFSLVLLLFTVALCYPVRRSVGSTVSVFGNRSQVQSFQGRISIWQAAFRMFKNHPWTGTGANNYPLFQAPYLDHTNSRPLSGRAFNTFLQLLAENGVIGFSVYVFLVLWLLYLLFKSTLKRRDEERLVGFMCCAAVIALWVRDTSYSSLLTHFSTAYLFWMLLFQGSAGE